MGSPNVEQYDNCTNSINEAIVLNLSIYPNPAEGVFVIEFGNSIEDGEIQVRNGLGQLMMTQYVSNSSRVSFDKTLAPGVYTVAFVSTSLTRTHPIKLVVR